MGKILVTGALGQIGSELILKLREKYGKDSLVATDIKQPDDISIEFQKLDVLDKDSLEKTILDYEVDKIYHLAAILSARGEKKPQLAFKVNLLGLYNILEMGRKHNLKQIIWPSSVAAFGPETPKDNTPNETILRPTTMYGITKVTGELLGNYYFHKYNLDVRGVRFPGIISYKTLPGGGTTDYAVEIFYEALKNKRYACYLKENAKLPMLYMPDAIKALIDLSEADISQLEHHCDFNLGGMSFSPEELAKEIRKHIPEFECEYEPDERQKFADSWPNSIDDSAAREEWGWDPDYGLEEMTEDMLEKLSQKLEISL